MATLAVEQLLVNVLGSPLYGGDFRGGIFPAGRAVLAGTTPYPPADAHRLLVLMHAFVTPPPIAILVAPISALPASVALGLFNVGCVLALCGALFVMGVRDKRIYLLALCSFPFWESLENGQPDGLFALAAAVTWRYRDDWRGAVAAAALIAAKLLAWPLVIWMLVTRRFRSAWLTVVATVGILLGSWALIGFRGLAQYPSLVAADARAFERFPLSTSLVEALSPLGLPLGWARVLALTIAVALAAAVVMLARDADEGWFTGALVLGLLSSPVVWFHYVVVLYVPFAFARRRRLLMWMVVAYGFWGMLILLHTPLARTTAFVAVTAGVAIWATADQLPGFRRASSRVGSNSSIGLPAGSSTST